MPSSSPSPSPSPSLPADPRWRVHVIELRGCDRKERTLIVRAHHADAAAERACRLARKRWGFAMGAIGVEQLDEGAAKEGAA